MTFEVLGDLNWIAVIAAALAYFVLGGIWYAPPVMGDAWMKASGIEMTGEGPGPAIYLAPFLGCLVAAIATGMLALATASETFSEGLALGLVIAVGYAAVLIGVTAVFETQKASASRWAVITGAYHVLGFVLTAIIVSVWN